MVDLLIPLDPSGPKKPGDFRSEAREEMVPDGDRMDVTESPASLTEVWPKMVGYWLSDTRFFLK